MAILGFYLEICIIVYGTYPTQYTSVVHCKISKSKLLKNFVLAVSNLWWLSE